jgi:diaminopimelate decarboxylase
VGPKVTNAVEAACKHYNYPLPELLLEPGRSIIGRAGVTLYTVGTVKNIPEIDKTYVAVDGGMGDNIRPALYQADYSAVVLNRLNDAATRTVTVAGKYCESGDVILRDLLVPESIAPGDSLLVFSTGAYNYSMSSQYNRVPRPAMVWLDATGNAHLLVRRETLDDLMALDC